MKRFLVVGLVFLMGFMFLTVDGYAKEKTRESRISYGFPFYVSGLQYLMGPNSDGFGGSWLGIGFKKFPRPERFWGMDFNLIFYNLHRSDDTIDMGIGGDIDVKLGAFFSKNCYAVLGSGIAITELGEDQPLGRFRVIIYPLCGIGYELMGEKDRIGFGVEVGMKGRTVYLTFSMVMASK